MKLATLIIGIITIVGMFIGFIPCLGWFNWVNLPLAMIGIILGAIDYNNQRTMLPQDTEYPGTYKRPFPLGLVLCTAAFVFGLLRLIAGGGII